MHPLANVNGKGVLFVAKSNYIEISKAALDHNAAAITEAVSVPVIGVVKCDGYGVTLAEAAAAWERAGAMMLAVSRPEEATNLRKMGYRKDILLLAPVADGDTLAEMLKYDVILTVTSFQNAQFYSLYSFGQSPRVHIAIDTGMGRFGIRCTDTEQIQAVYFLAGLRFEGIFSHFSRSFEGKYRYTKLQLEHFLLVTDALQAAGFPVGLRHIANTNAALRFPETRLDAVRIGSGLVGISHSDLELVSVKTNYAQVVECRLLSPGERIGYGGHCVIRECTKAIVVSLGKMDGFGEVTVPEPLRLRNFLSYLWRVVKMRRHPPCVIYQGKRLPMLGQVGNQHTLFDATGTDIHPGDMVLWEGSLLNSRSQRKIIEN